MSKALQSPYRLNAVARIQGRVLDALAREACIGAMALSAVIGDWARADVMVALRGLVRQGVVEVDGCRRGARYRLVGRAA